MQQDIKSQEIVDRADGSDKDHEITNEGHVPAARDSDVAFVNVVRWNGDLRRVVVVRKNSVRAGFRVDVTLLHRNRVLVSDFLRSTPVEPDSTAGFTLRALVGMQERENLPLGKEKTSPAARLLYVSLDRSRRRHRGWPAFLFFLPTRPNGMIPLQ